ncbi:MAG: leucine-rich repeat domain-containing protein [Candidatus Neomarinimicrobiota bacterium]
MSFVLGQDCDDDEIYIWDYCFSIDSTFSIDLTGENLSGSIPSEIGLLTNLMYLNLSANNLSGSIPLELGNLINLNYLYLQNNNLSGSIPSTLGGLVNLKRLKLYSNQLTGNIPMELYALDSLIDLSMYYNHLDGYIAPQIGGMSSLETLYLFQNDFDGHIPPEIGNLTNLKHLYLQGNNLTGSIPSEIGSLISLESLYLHDNQLAGVIPSSIINLSQLNYLWINNNQITGEIPCNICEMQLDLGSTSNVRISNNQLCAPYPSCIIENIGSQDTTLCSSIPKRQFYIYNQCYIIEDTDSLNLAENNLQGSIPVEIGELVNLRYLFLYGNDFSGEIPSEFGNLTNLNHLYLYDNNLSGSIPIEIGNLTSLTHLFIQNNQLEGEISSILNDLSNLEFLYLNDNNLIGHIDPNLCGIDLNWGNSLYSNISNNSFCPPYPSCLEDIVGYQDTSNCSSDLKSMIGFSKKNSIYDAYPNPSNASIVFRYDLLEKVLLEITIYDLSGKLIKNLFEGVIKESRGSIVWDGKNNLGKYVSSGTYICKYQTQDWIQSQRIILLK